MKLFLFIRSDLRLIAVSQSLGELLANSLLIFIMDTNSHPNLAMNISTSIEPISTLKSHSAELIKRSRESKQPVVITQNGKPTAVIQDVESFQEVQNSLNMLKIVLAGEKDYQEGNFTSDVDFRKEMKEKLASLKRSHAE
jgi:prevent-host-death family protein